MPATLEDDDLENDDANPHHDEDEHDEPDDADESDDSDTSDADEEDEEEQDDLDEDDEEEDSAPSKKARGRGDKRIRNLKGRLNSQEQLNQRLMTQLEEALNLTRTNAGNTSEAEEQARLAAMEPHEREAYYADKRIRGLEGSMNALRFQMADTADHAAFHAQVASNPIYAKHAGRVEETLAAMRKKGSTAAREDVLAYLIGKDALMQAKKGKDTKKKAAASERVAAAKGKPVSARGDSGATKRGKTAAERLEGVFI